MFTLNQINGALGNLEVNLNDDIKKLNNDNIDDYLLLILRII
jgi:hypothetical protein